MNDIQKESIEKLVVTFAKEANITDPNEIASTIRRLQSMDENDVIDTIIVTLNGLLNSKRLTQKTIFDNVESIIKINPKKYKTANDLIDRLNWIKSMNMEYTHMPLTENHQLAMTVFDEFNKLLEGDFDCYYTGGIMGYIATNHPLERYHSDLDLFINEEQLESLKERIDNNPDFEFISNMAHKEVHGHEYKIVYQGRPLDIGLFLFAREEDGSITTKEYYFENENTINGQLLVDEHHFTKEYTTMAFSDTIRYYNNTPYKMMSLESIYNSKKNSRPKDRYDAQVIQDNVNMEIVHKLDIERNNNTTICQKPAIDSVIKKIENKMHSSQNKENTESNPRRI